MLSKTELEDYLSTYWPDYALLASKNLVSASVATFLSGEKLEPIYVPGGSDSKQQDFSALVIATCTVINTTVLIHTTMKPAAVPPTPQQIQVEVLDAHPDVQSELVESILHSEEFMTFLKDLAGELR